MGFAMMDGWLRKDPALKVHVVEPNDALRQRAVAAGASAAGAVDDLSKDIEPALVVVAVKPNLVASVLGECGRFALEGTTFVSVAAGVTTAAMSMALPTGAAVIRCMPNTPASIGEGMMVLFAQEGVTARARELTATLFASSGAVAWIESEEQMDAVTAISGSGPAYVFHFLEVLIEAGTRLGLARATAELLAKQTVAGASRLALLSNEDVASLREQVTSPGGTTAAALQVFMMDDRTTTLVAEATRAARDRSIELGKPKDN
jgi:pyrroline-5-carboxylate reductase